LGRDLTDAGLELLVPWSFRRRPGKLRRRIEGLPRASGAKWEHGIPAKNGEVLRLVFETVKLRLGAGRKPCVRLWTLHRRQIS